MPQSLDGEWGWGGSDHCVLPHPTLQLLCLGTHRAQLSDSLTTGVGRGQWAGELGQGLEDLYLPHPGISGGRRESRSALFQSRVVLGTTASAPSAGLSTRRGKRRSPLQHGRVFTGRYPCGGLQQSVELEAWRGTRSVRDTPTPASWGLRRPGPLHLTLPLHCFPAASECQPSSPGRGHRAMLAKVPARVRGRTGSGVLASSGALPIIFLGHQDPGR